MFTYTAIVKRVVDGDTIDVDIDLGFRTFLYDERLRLYGIDAPETRTKNLDEKARGLTAKARVEQLCPVGTKIKVKTLRDAKEKFGRYLALVYVNDTELNKLLLDEGLVKEYYGDAKE